jgi:high-affinity iron transporter
VRGRVICLAAVALGLLAGNAAAATSEPWQVAADLRLNLADAQKALVLGDTAQAQRLVARSHALSLGVLSPVRRDLRSAQAAVRAGDPVALEVARTRVWATVLGTGAREALRSIRRGDARSAGDWLLVREYRKPTRFSRPGADATLAVAALAKGRVTPRAAAATARTDLLDTYQSRLRGVLEEVDDASGRGFDVRLAGTAAQAEGYFAVLAASYADQRGAAARRTLTRSFSRLSAAAAAGDDAGVRAARSRIDRGLEGFRAAPLSHDETWRRAGQLQRFVSLVPVEYARGVDNGRVTLDFEVQGR